VRYAHQHVDRAAGAEGTTKRIGFSGQRLRGSAAARRRKQIRERMRMTHSAQKKRFDKRACRIREPQARRAAALVATRRPPRPGLQRLDVGRGRALLPLRQSSVYDPCLCQSFLQMSHCYRPEKPLLTLD